MITVTSKKFSPLLFPSTDGGTTYINGCIMDAYQAEIKFYIEKKALTKRLQFTSSDKTITNANQIDNTSFLDYGFCVGEKIKIVHSGVLNQGNFTITAITERVITVSEAVSDELTRAGDIYLNPAAGKITNMDFYYNMVETSNQRRQPLGNAWGPRNPNRISNLTNYISLTDKGVIQKYSATGLDCEDDIEHRLLTVATDSHAWVADVVTGITSTSYIVGDGLDGYKQKFKLIHRFKQAPLFLLDQFSNMQSGKTPSYFSGTGALSYNCQIDLKYSAEGDVADVGEILDANGKNSWYNQNNARSRPEYSFVSIKYIDSDTLEILDKLDFTKTVNVELKIYSVSGKFVSGLVDTGTQLVVSHLYCPLDATGSEDTSTTLLQNYFNDFVSKRVGVLAASNGTGYGTAYQVITGLTATRVDANNVTINFTVDYSDEIKSLLATKGDADRNYSFIVTTQDISITTAANVDRVAIICDFKNMDYDQRNPALLDLVDHFYCYTYPNLDTAFANISAYEGKKCFVQVPFTIDTADELPIINTAGIQIVAVKTDKEDFIVEERIIQCSQYPFLGSVQQINFSESRGYKLPDGDIFNLISLSPDSSYDSGNKKGYVLSYAFTLRDESWQTNETIQPGSQYDIQRDISKITNRWADLIANGWTLKIRFVADVEDENGVITPYQSQTDLNIIKSGVAPGGGVAFVQQTFFLDEDDNRVDSIIKGGNTKIISLFTPNPVALALHNVEPTQDAVTHYEFNIGHAGLTPFSVSLFRTVTFIDQGDGTLIGDDAGASTGTIDYETGDVVLDFAIAPDVPAYIQAAFIYNPLADIDNPTQIIGSASIDKKNGSGGQQKRRVASTAVDGEADSPFTPTEANPSADLSWATNNLRINIFGTTSLTIETIYRDTSTTFGSDPCDESAVIEVGPEIVISIDNTTPGTSTTEDRVFSDGEAHLLADGTPDNF